MPTLVQDNHYVNQPYGPDEGYHLNRDLSDESVEYINDLRNASPDQPFFLYYSPGAGHGPHHVEKEWIEKYHGRYDMGWDKLREQIYERQLAESVIPEGTVLTERLDWIRAWDDLSEDERKLYARQMEVFEAQLEQTDHHIGRVLDHIEKLGEADNTLVMIASDNGASGEGGDHGSFNENGNFNSVWHPLELQVSHIDTWGGPDTLPNYASDWAWAGNTPLRRWKRYLHQGGISDP